MRRSLIEAVRQQYGFACGYCGISETNAGSHLTIDHFQPRSQGGNDDIANLVYSCHACNEHKGDYWNPDGFDRLLHPVQDIFSNHFVLQDDDTLRPVTEMGRFHIIRLQLNRPALIQYRRHVRENREDRENRAAYLAVLQAIESEIKAVREEIRQLRIGSE